MIAATLLFARTAGFADNNKAIIIILIIVTVGYAVTVWTVHSRGRKLEQKDVRMGQKSTAAETGVKRKKKK
jgi:hypothetical protein